jgi:ABC-type multidrug transport system permease subunit
MKIKEAPGFLLIGFLTSLVCFFICVVMYLREAFSLKGWVNDYLAAPFVFFFVLIYFAYNIRKAMEDPHDQDRCG